MAAMCSGVLPQQPPAMLSRPLSANSPRKRPMSAGSRSKPVGERVGQAGVGVAGDGRVGLRRELGEEGVHEVGAEGAVEADGEGLDVAHGVPERLDGLRGDHGLAAAADGGGDHDRQADLVLGEDLLDGDERGLGVERVEDGLDQQQVDAAGDERAHLAA
jgi:hypothetical protein